MDQPRDIIITFDDESSDAERLSHFSSVHNVSPLSPYVTEEVIVLFGFKGTIFSLGRPKFLF
jgi:hypothetical protein